MNILQQVFQLYLSSLGQVFTSAVLSDIFYVYVLHSFVFIMYFLMVFFVTFVPVYYSLYLLYKAIINKNKL